MQTLTEILLVRFTKAQRATIRRISKQRKLPEAEVVRRCVDLVYPAKKI